MQILSNMAPIIQVTNLSKRYRINHQRSGYIALRDILTNIGKHPLAFLGAKAKIMIGKDRKEDFWALKDINFSVEQGEVIGIIGHNGAGKSTLLKILSKITPPTTGTIQMRGRVGSLLEVGTGFHPELTGRENIFLNGAILGMSRQEIKQKFDEIVDFAGIEQFLDTPVKFYSSGMYVRLAFSVAAHLEPDILIIDEVLAVGDAEFQKKCLGKMEEVTKKEGRTILFVSHNMGAIQQLCGRCILLERGRTASIGATDQIIESYLHTSRTIVERPLSTRIDRKGNGALRFSNIRVESLKGIGKVATGKPFSIKLFFDLKDQTKNLENVAISITINDEMTGKHLLAFWTETSGSNFSIENSKKFIECQIEKCPLIFGYYQVNIYCTINGVVSDYVLNATEINVDDTEYFSHGVRDHENHPKYVTDHSWKIQ